MPPSKKKKNVSNSFKKSRDGFEEKGTGQKSTIFRIEEDFSRTRGKKKGVLIEDKV